MSDGISIFPPSADARGTQTAEVFDDIRANLTRKAMSDAQHAATSSEARTRADLRSDREQLLVRLLDADTAAKRAQATVSMARAAAVTGTAGLAGFAIGGPVGGAVGVVVGWIADHIIERSQGGL